MKKLSLRLQGVYDFIPQTNCLVDIGCDHCALTIEVAKKQKANIIIASDINEKPLQICHQNITNNNLEGKIKLVLSNGFNQIKDHFSTVVIAGLGAKTICQILRQRDDLQDKTLVLQPQNKIVNLRSFLKAKHLKITNECLVKEKGIIYTIMLVNNKGQEIKNELDLFVGPIIKKQNSPLAYEKFSKRLNFLNKIIKHGLKPHQKLERKILQKYLQNYHESNPNY